MMILLSLVLNLPEENPRAKCPRQKSARRRPGQGGYGLLLWINQDRGQGVQRLEYEVMVVTTARKERAIWGKGERAYPSEYEPQRHLLG